MDKNALNEALAAVMAAELLKKLTPEMREEFFETAVAKALKDYSITNLIEKSVKAEAEKAVAELLATPTWQLDIKAAVREGMLAYLAKLPDAVEKACVRALHGKDSTGSYSNPQPGIVLDFLKEK